MYDDADTPAQAAGDSADPPPSQPQAPPRPERAVSLPPGPTTCNLARIRDRWCRMLLWVLAETPKTMPWTLRLSNRPEEGLMPVLHMVTPKKHALPGRPILLKYCPFCGRSVLPPDLDA